VQEKISGGKARITGYFTMDEAKTLAIALRSGALPAPVTILENRTVGPSLGQDSVHQGIKAIVIGGLLVVVFMIIYYGFSGVIADVALLFNFIIIIGALSYLGATLTLPGIAGIILTIGMAVDANVLIFERIREELRLGKTVRAAVGSGFDRALITILDANITTLIAGLVLFQFGTGPVKGFAVTLSLGIIGTLFTALFVSRTFFDSIMARPRVQKISI
jgi:preprotein translocase subunit SecD